MMTLIKLTIAKTNYTGENAGKIVYVNPAQIAFFHRYLNATVISFPGGETEGIYLHVEESPKEIAEMIFNAEHPFHQQKINVTDEVLAELKNAKPTLQVLPDEPSISYEED